ncbi:hypothetical protein [Aliamphritea spongicola]|nr:hypothetical protein [Aliamphritea spongicola]
MPAAIALLLGWLSWRQVWQGVALVEVLVALLLAMWLLQRFYPVKESGQTGAKGETADSGWRRGQVLRDSGFWLMAPAMFAPSMFITAFFFISRVWQTLKALNFRSGQPQLWDIQ